MRQYQSLSHAVAESLVAQLQTRIYAVPVLLALGIGLYFIWPHEPTLTQPILTTLFLAIVAWWLAGLQDYSWRYLAILALMIVVSGFGAAKIRAIVVDRPMIQTPIGPVGVEGRVASLEQLEGGVGVRVMIDDLVIDDIAQDATPQALRLSIRKGGDDLKVGMRARFFAKIEPPSPPTTPGGFDFRRHAYFKQIGGYGYVLGAPKMVAGPDANSVGGWFENTRNHISELVNKTLDPRQAGMVAALLTGERAAINKEDWQALRDSGLAHLLAISGANVDMVAIIVFFTVRLLMAAIPSFALRHPIKKYAAVMAWLAALTYVLLIYPSTPTLRALLMVTIVLLAVLLDRSPISLRLVCATAIAILVFWPEQLLSPSFQLSYAAVTALVAVFEWAGPWLKRVHRDAPAVTRATMYLLGVCATTAIATIATAPISLYHFQTLALYGVIANVVAVPIMTFLIMPLAILCYVMIPLGVAEPSLHVLGTLCDWILDIAHATAEMPGARLTPPAMPLSALLLIVGAGLILCLGAKWFKGVAVLPLLIAIIVLWTHEHPHAVILQGGKVVMQRLENGEIITNTRRFARRQQTDWVRYWGGDEVKGARVVKGIAIGPRACPGGPEEDDGPPAFAEGLGCDFKIPQTLAPVAIYKDHVEIVGPRVRGRLWD